MGRPSDILGGEGEHELVIEPIIGWRAWNTSRHSHVLVSPQRGDEWQGGKLVWDGVCRCEIAHQPTLRDRSKLIYHRILFGVRRATSCHCGINAYADIDLLERSSYIVHDAIGRCHLEGEVRGYEHGWRAQRAEVTELWATSHLSALRVTLAAWQLGVPYRGVWHGDADEREARINVHDKTRRRMNAWAGAVAALGCSAIMLLPTAIGEIWPWSWSMSVQLIALLYLLMLPCYVMCGRNLVRYLELRVPARPYSVESFKLARTLVFITGFMLALVLAATGLAPIVR